MDRCLTIAICLKSSSTAEKYTFLKQAQYKKKIQSIHNQNNNMCIQYINSNLCIVSVISLFPFLKWNDKEAQLDNQVIHLNKAIHKHKVRTQKNGYKSNI